MVLLLPPVTLLHRHPPPPHRPSEPGKLYSDYKMHPHFPLIAQKYGNCFGTLESTECLPHPGEDLDGKLWLILVLSSNYPGSTLSNMAGSRLYSWSHLHTTWGVRVGKAAAICALIAASHHRGADKETGSNCHFTSPIVASSFLWS